jgi:hypothetical protein
MRRHALVMLGFRINWLFTIDPEWTERSLLPLVEDFCSDGDALWDGVLWRADAPPRLLFLALKSSLLARATDPHRRNEKTILAGFLLAGWGNEEVTDIELREVLIHADDEFRQQLLWQLGRWAEEPNSPWRETRPLGHTGSRRLSNCWHKRRRRHRMCGLVNSGVALTFEVGIQAGEKRRSGVPRPYKDARDLGCDQLKLRTAFP